MRTNDHYTFERTSKLLRFRIEDSLYKSLMNWRMGIDIYASLKSINDFCEFDVSSCKADE